MGRISVVVSVGVRHPLLEFLDKLLGELPNLPLSVGLLPHIEKVHKRPSVARERHIDRSAER